VESAAVVEVTSEDTAYPIESALLSGEKRGWRAEKPGTQTIRLIFDEPQNLRRIWLVFDETETRRPRIPSAMGCRYRPFFPRNRAPAVEF
jgi:XRCC1 N terminal domain